MIFAVVLFIVIDILGFRYYLLPFSLLLLPCLFVAVLLIGLMIVIVLLLSSLLLLCLLLLVAVLPCSLVIVTLVGVPSLPSQGGAVRRRGHVYKYGEKNTERKRKSHHAESVKGHPWEQMEANKLWRSTLEQASADYPCQIR